MAEQSELDPHWAHRWVVVLQTGRRVGQFAFARHSTQIPAVSQYGVGGPQSPELWQVFAAPPAPVMPPVPPAPVELPPDAELPLPAPFVAPPLAATVSPPAPAAAAAPLPPPLPAPPSPPSIVELG